MGLMFKTTKGRELSKVLKKNYYFLSTGSPTYWPTNDNKILDFFITNGMSTTYVDIQASYDLTSDHTPRTPMSHPPRKPTQKSSTRHKDSYITNSLEYIINKTTLLNRYIGINPGQNFQNLQ